MIQMYGNGVYHTVRTFEVIIRNMEDDKDLYSKNSEDVRDNECSSAVLMLKSNAVRL